MGRRAILVTYPERFALNEAVGLAEAADYEVVKIVTQRYLTRAKYGIGSGKAEEVRRLVQQSGAGVVLFDERLRSAQAYNLAKITRAEVIDREKLILEIFNKRASTAEAKLQVQMAELRYEMPRAKEKVRLAKMGEQPGFLGLGMYEAEIYYRDFKKRISALSERLEQVSKRRELYRAQRERLKIPTVSLAGYTGVGKTALFNLLTSESKEVARGAFTTLATTTRAVELLGSRALLSDTVGFIDRLPTYMIEAFKSTLDELTFADLVLLLLDVSEPLDDMVRKFRSCAKTLSELGVSPFKVTLVFNKADLEGFEEIMKKVSALGSSYETSLVISAKTGLGIDKLKERVRELVLECSEAKVTLRQEMIKEVSEEVDWLKENAYVRIVENGDGTVTAMIKGPSWMIGRFREACNKKAERVGRGAAHLGS